MIGKRNLAAVLVLTSGCVAKSSHDVLLYADANPPWPRSQVSRVVGYVQYIDGYDVSALGNAFELQPGCHVVGTPARWGKMEANIGGATVDTGTVSYAIIMRAGFEYFFTVEFPEMSGPVGTARLVAVERGRGGTTTRSFAPAQTQAELDGCLAQGPGVVVTP